MPTRESQSAFVVATREVGQQLLSAAGIAGAVRLAQRFAHRRTRVFGQLVEDVPRLVRLASLDEPTWAEHVADRLRQRLRATDDDECGELGAPAGR